MPRTLTGTCLPILVALALSSLGATAEAESPPREDTIFFATTVGGGLAMPGKEQFDPGPTPGGYWEVTVGWGLTRHLALGIDFGTWQNSWLGLPYHFHNAFAPRLELAPLDSGDGLILSLAAGLGTTDGVEPPKETRHGIAITPRISWRWALGSSAAVALVTGLHVHVYVEGGQAFNPYAAIELRFFGRHDVE